MSEPRVWVNGQPVDERGPSLSALDRGFTLGDGIFETMRARAGRVFSYDYHLARLRRGAAITRIPLPPPEELEQIIATALADVPPTEWTTLRLTISRGIPRQRGLLPDPDATPTVVLHRSPLVPYPARVYEQGMHAITTRITRNNHSPLSSIKAVGYLENVLARQEAAAHLADEVLLRNNDGNVVCASAMNLFVVFGTSLVTPPLTSGVIPGTVRALILDELAPRAGLKVQEGDFKAEALYSCTEAFLTNALAGIVPLTQLDTLPIGSGSNAGKPGAWSRHLQEMLAQRWDAL